MPCHICTTQCDHSTCADLGFSTPHQHHLIKLDNHRSYRQKRNRKKYRHTDCLAYAVTTMFYRVVAIQRRPQYTYNVLHRQSPPWSNAGGYRNIVTHTFVCQTGAPFVFYISLHEEYMLYVCQAGVSFCVIHLLT